MSSPDVSKTLRKRKKQSSRGRRRFSSAAEVVHVGERVLVPDLSGNGTQWGTDTTCFISVREYYSTRGTYAAVDQS